MISFLFPNFGKILIFLSLFVVYSFLPVFPYNYQVWCIQAPCYPELRFVQLFELFTRENVQVPALINATNYPIFAFEMILVYILSCALSEIFKPKLKNK